MTHWALAVLVEFSVLGAGEEQDFAVASRRALATGRPLVVLLGAEWCPACKLMKNATLPQIAAQGGFDGVELAYVDVDQQAGLAEKLLRGRLLPQLILFYKTPLGWQSRRLIGGQTAEKIAMLMDRHAETALAEADTKPGPEYAANPSQERRPPVANPVPPPVPSPTVVAAQPTPGRSAITTGPDDALPPNTAASLAGLGPDRAPKDAPAVSRPEPPSGASPDDPAPRPDEIASVPKHTAKLLAVYPIGRVEQSDGRTRIVLDREYLPGLRGLDEFMHIYVFWWSDDHDTPQERAILQVATPSEGQGIGGSMTGVFATHARTRPNLITFSLCKVVGVEDNVVEIEGIDAAAGTSVLDIRPLGPRVTSAKAIPGDWSRTR